MDEPRISVVVPVYNAEPYLEECIASVLEQQGVALELILVDDASTDGSSAVCEAAAEANPSVVKYLLTKGLGVSAARNLGASEARGEFVCFADADDKLLPESLKMMLEIADSQPDVDIVVGRFVRSEEWRVESEEWRVKCEEGRVKSEEWRVVSEEGRVKSEEWRLESAEEALADTLYQVDELHHPSAWAKLCRRCTVLEAFTPGRRYEDLESVARIYLKARKIAFVDKPVYYYRPNPSSFINTITPARFDALWAVDSLRAQLADNETLARAALARSFSAYYNMYALACKGGGEASAPGGEGQSAGGEAGSACAEGSRGSAEARCLAFIKAHRAAMLTDCRVRLKNKAGALLSYLGRRLMRAACR